MNYTQIKKEVSDRYDKLFTECDVFWAFSQEQFEEGKAKHPLEDGDKYVNIGAGGIMPRSSVEKLNAGTKAINAWRKLAVKEMRQDQQRNEQAILYELNNYEAFYTGDITDAMEVLAELGYTEKQVKEVYRKNRNKVADAGMPIN